MFTQEFQTNRARFPRPELEKYRGQWVAFSPDGCRIVASGATLERLEDSLAAAGHDPEQVAFEYVSGPEGDVCLGWEEFRE